ncbi:MAG: CHAT domain-containing protein [Planctomycetaceae bacterium]
MLQQTRGTALPLEMLFTVRYSWLLSTHGWWDTIFVSDVSLSDCCHRRRGSGLPSSDAYPTGMDLLMSLDVHEFQYHLEHADTGWQVSGSCSQLVGETGPICLPKTNIDDAILLGSFLDIELSSRDVAASVGARLFDLLFVGEVRTQFLRAWAISRQTRCLLRLLIRYPGSDRRIHSIPWELLFARDGSLGDFLVLSPDILFARCLRQLHPTRQVAVDGRVRILYTSACPPTRAPLDVHREKCSVTTALGEQAKVTEYVTVERASLASLRFSFQESQQPIHVWHHSGHGIVRAATVRFALVIERGGDEEVVSDQEIADILKTCPDLRFVVVNTCHGAHKDGLVPTLAALNVPAVLGYRNKIRDDVAVRLTTTLYTGLMSKPIDLAVRDARRSLLGTNCYLDSLLPILFLRTVGATLVPTARYKTAYSHSRPVFPSLKPKGINKTCINVSISNSMTGNLNAFGRLKIGDSMTPDSESEAEINLKITESSVGHVNPFGDVSVPSKNAVEFLRCVSQLPSPPDTL